MYLYRATKDPYLLHVGIDILESIEHSTKTKCGYATVSSAVLLHFYNLNFVTCPEGDWYPRQWGENQSVATFQNAIRPGLVTLSNNSGSPEPLPNQSQRTIP